MSFGGEATMMKHKEDGTISHKTTNKVASAPACRATEAARSPAFLFTSAHCTWERFFFLWRGEYGRHRCTTVQALTMW
eukprot:CAMPEP_0206490858 /NCGR_PEP_ID=MMETSP0324_2-20121206/44458_1 /ASSEMBLY_ACC=CAM_ASM_000836 /TAXON_ID=2866 /ORGANISM="Crypthecodinium cohnii, Strain Seligo" /LENGTH=77 /DNA_ID=CAMNT_0053971553 /DNA_START=225 /DNA_END=455 /DNA_ORIENTATION=+